MTLEDRHQFLLGAVLYNAYEDPITALVESQDRDLTPGTTSSLASYSAGSEVALINLNVTSKGLHLLEGHLHQPLPHEGVNSVHGTVVQACQLGCREAGKICCKEADHCPKSGLRNVRTF